MNNQLIIVAAICLTYVTFALPVPDEEVSGIQTSSESEVTLDIAKKPENIIKLLKSATSIETHAVGESKPIGKPSSSPAPITASLIIDAKKVRPKVDIKLDAPDTDTTPSITKKKLSDRSETKESIEKVVYELMPAMYSASRALVDKPTALPKGSVTIKSKDAENIIFSERHVKNKSKEGSEKNVTKAKEINEPISTEKKSNKNENERTNVFSSLGVPMEPVAISDFAVAATDISSTTIQSSHEEKLLITEEKQRVRLERIDKQDTAAVTAPTNETKAVENVEVIPSFKQSHKEQVKTTLANEKISDKLNQNAYGDEKQNNSNVEENYYEKNAAAAVENLFARDSKKIEGDDASVKPLHESKVEKDTKKTTTEAQQQLKFEYTKINSEEKYNRKRQSEELGYSSESKESNESEDSKKDKSN